MSNVIPFESGKLPAYLKDFDISALNADLTAHASTGGFPVISIKGKVFAVVRDGDRKVLPNPKDPDSPATSIDVVILKANKGTSKVFYAKGWTEGAESTKPDCFSNEGIKPDPSVEKPQSKACGTCPHNQWGSKIGETGGKGKACQDSVRLAVSTPDQINEPYLLRVPPASIRPLGDYGDMLKKRGVGYNMVVTKIGFDLTAPTPKLVFKAVGLIDDSSFSQVQDTVDTDTVRNILGSGFTASEALAEAPSDVEAVVEKAKTASKSKVVTEEEVTAAIEAAAPSAPAAKPKKEMTVDLDLDDLNFDD